MPDETTSEAQAQKSPRREISDPMTMRALAHPVRLALLEKMQEEGELTATRAAELLGESPGNMSWHLQTLAKYGFIEEAEGAKGRSRPWKINASSNRFSAREDDPASMAAGQQLATLLIERSYERLREWWAHQQSFSKQWRDAAYINDSMNFMTAAELATLSEQITELLMQFNDRLDPARRPEGALPVHFTAYSHPLPPTTSLD